MNPDCDVCLLDTPATNGLPAPEPLAHHDPLIRRYARQAIIEGFDQAKLGRGKVLVVGVGTLGSPVVLTLALAGVGMSAYGGTLALADFDRLEPVNLTRWPLGAQPEDLGRNKAEVAVERLRMLNPDVQAVAWPMDVTTDLGAAQLAQFDVIVLCVDNLYARVHLNRTAALWGAIKPIPIVEGGLDGLHWAVHTFIPGATACYECLMQDEDYREMNRRRSCMGQQQTGVDGVAMPMSAISAAPAAGIMAQEVVQILLGQPPAYAGRELRFYAGRGEPARVFQVPQRSGCPGHQALDPARLVVLPFDATTLVGELRGLAAQRLGVPADTLLLVHDQQILYGQSCPHCGYTTPAETPPQLLDRAVLTACPQCPPAGPDADEQLLTVDGSRHLRRDDLSLAAHGVPSLPLVRAYGADGAEWVLVPHAAELVLPAASA